MKYGFDWTVDLGISYWLCVCKDSHGEEVSQTEKRL